MIIEGLNIKVKCILGTDFYPFESRKYYRLTRIDNQSLFRGDWFFLIEDWWFSRDSFQEHFIVPEEVDKIIRLSGIVT